MHIQNHDGDTFTSTQAPIVQGGQGRQVDMLTGANCLLGTLAGILLIGFIIITLILVYRGAPS